jgi:HEAT repeat protein
VSEASAAVRWLLQQAEPEARRVAVQQIGKVPSRDAPELLLRALGDDDWRVRKDGAAAAPTLDGRDEVVTALIAALEETANIGLRNAAVEALIAVVP